MSGQDDKDRQSSPRHSARTGTSQPHLNTLPQPETPPLRLLHFFGLPTSGDIPIVTLLWRWLSFWSASVVAYILLDNCAVYLQVWNGISAWYPPVGLCFALFIYLGRAAFLPMLTASFLAAAINYHLSPFSLDFLLISPLVPSIYFGAAWALRKRLKRDLRLKSVSDVLILLAVSLFSSLTSACIGTAVLVWAGSVPRGAYLNAAFNWWIGDAVALFSVTPLLTEFLMVDLRRFLGLSTEIQRTTAVPSHHRSFGSVLTTCATFSSSLLLILLFIFGWNFSRSAHCSTFCSFP